MPESPEEKETASEKHKNNSGSDVHIKSIYQNIPKNTIYWNIDKILCMLERLVPGPYLSPSTPARVKGPGYDAIEALALALSSALSKHFFCNSILFV